MQEGNINYNICLPPVACKLMVTVQDDASNEFVGNSELISIVMSDGTSIPIPPEQSVGIWLVIVNPELAATITVNGGEFYNGGDNVTQTTPPLPSGPYTEQFLLDFAHPLPIQGGGCRL